MIKCRNISNKTNIIGNWNVMIIEIWRVPRTKNYNASGGKKKIVNSKSTSLPQKSGRGRKGAAMSEAMNPELALMLSWYNYWYIIYWFLYLWNLCNKRSIATCGVCIVVPILFSWTLLGQQKIIASCFCLWAKCN